MKFSITLLTLMAGLTSVWAQSESDDVYFTSRDRKLEIAVRPKTNTYTNSSAQELASTQSPAFDGQYTGRTINPDYDPAVGESAESAYSYYNPAYAPVGVNKTLYGYNNSYSNNGFNSPNPYSYYGSGFGSPWGYNRGWNNFNYYDPFNSWGSYGMGMGMGMGWGSGFGNNWYGGFGSGCYSCWSLGSSFGWGNSMWMGSSFGMPMYGLGGWGGGGWYTQNNFFYGNNFDNQQRLTYGRRPSRSTNYANDAREPVRRNNMVVGGTTSRSTANGRSAAAPANTYYQRGWRQDESINPRPTSTYSTGSSPWNSSRSGMSNSGNDNSGWRSSGSGFSSGGSRSGGFSSPGGSSGGSSSGGRRGRN